MSQNSYIRTQGLILTAANTTWDKNNKIDKIYKNNIEKINQISRHYRKKSDKIWSILNKKLINDYE
ncbi:hypothetical protein RBH29_11345 [Herbivorax sp. ANBcel31]|uniref:hypothetical protein n=1 Tax=Herbivorax sp. ANBcel31 TaxID=3069754 RepID=UPI0027B12AD4|nr:hypothetical protein [Herbivorax sp. ANBcel31]MDQ2087022.1 hypothetical protein [Herbivorax sp. ANBcel31]